MQAVDIRGRTPGEPEMREDLARLVSLIEESRVEEARILASHLATKWPESRDIQHMLRVLEPPKVIAQGSRPGRPRKQERGWLRAHAHEYPGCWLAVHGERLVAADPDRKMVIAAARAAGINDGVLLFFQPDPGASAWH